jgi:hypothetical protein
MNDDELKTYLKGKSFDELLKIIKLSAKARKENVYTQTKF